MNKIEPGPITMQKAGFSYTGTVVQKEGTIELERDTDVFLDIPPGIQGVIIAAVHTDPTPFLDVIPDKECIIAPIVTLCYRPKSEEYSLENLKKNPTHYFTVHIPHIAQKKKDSIIVRSGHSSDARVNNKPAYKDIPRTLVKGDIREASPKGTFITASTEHGDEILLQTQRFCTITVTSRECTCEKEAVALIYGGFYGHEKKFATTKAYLASPLYKNRGHRKVDGHHFNQ